MNYDPNLEEPIEEYDEEFPFWELCLLRHIREVAE